MTSAEPIAPDRGLGLTPRALADHLLPVVAAAGATAMEHFRAGCAVLQKADQSPVTVADHEVEALLLAALVEIAPAIPVVAEEAVAAGRVPTLGTTMFLVDPLDGTREFIDGSGEFTINVALIVEGVPCFGLVHAPAMGETYVTLAPDFAVRLHEPIPDFTPANAVPLRTRVPPKSGLTAMVSRSHGSASTDDLLAGMTIAAQVAAGSSLKFCHVAAGLADVYPRGGPTHEWDTAAGDAILRAAGGRVIDLAGRPLTYGHRERRFLNPAFVAWGR